MLGALLSWLESPACFQACISHLAAHAAAGGQSALSLFCQTSDLVSDTESGENNGEREMNVQWNQRGLLGVPVHFPVVIAYDGSPVLVLIEWWGFCSCLLYFKWFAWPGKSQVFSYFFFLSSAYLLTSEKLSFRKIPWSSTETKQFCQGVCTCVCVCVNTQAHTSTISFLDQLPPCKIQTWKGYNWLCAIGDKQPRFWERAGCGPDLAKHLRTEHYFFKGRETLKHWSKS